MKLDRKTVDRLEPSTARYAVWDSELPAFGIRVEPTGRKTFVVRYRAEGGGRGAAQRQKTLGSHGTLSPADARELAKDVLADVRRGLDPLAELQAKRREMTVEKLIDLYALEGLVVQRGIRRGTPMKPTTAKQTMARLRSHVVPLLGSRRASELTEGDIESMARSIAAGTTARDEKTGPRTRVFVRGGEGAARKVVRDFSAVSSFAIRRRIMSVNPVAAASVRKTDNTRKDAALTLDQVQRLGRSLDELENDGINSKAVNITRLWTLTGCRRNEIAGLQWTEVDLERGLLVFDDSKTGRSVRPLAAAAWALLKGLRADADADAKFVFPAERGDGFYVGTKRVWPAIVKKANLPGVTPHSLRHTVGSAGASGGEGLLLVGAILGHANARSTQIYAQVQHDPARLAADRVTGPLARALSGGKPDQGRAEAVPSPVPTSTGEQVRLFA